MADMQAYLAAKYMTGAKADAILARSEDGKRKKKKRKVQDDGSARSLAILDDDADDWKRFKEDEEEQAMVVESRAHAGFKPIVQKEEEPVETPDEAPQVVGPITQDPTPAPRPKKLKGGLQMAADVAKEAAQLKAAREAQQERERIALEEARRASGVADGEDDTVIRGPDGRPIDRKAAKAEEARRRRAEMEKEMAKMEWGKGLVQREDKERRKEEEAAIAAQPFARFADDAALNNQQKDVERWNDPAARFLTKEKPSKKKSSGPVRPRYAGPPPPPNRFGIQPGYRWDGVDRSNGFERKLNQSHNDRKVRQEIMHNWSTEDM